MKFYFNRLRSPIRMIESHSNSCRNVVLSDENIFQPKHFNKNFKKIEASNLQLYWNYRYTKLTCTFILEQYIYIYIK